MSLEILSNRHYANLVGGGTYGPELIAEVPLVTSAPGAPYASFKSISETIGVSDESPEPTFYRVPTKCPRGGFPFKAEVTFAENGEPSKPDVQQIKGLTYRTVTVYVNDKRVAVVKRQRFTAQVDLRGLPKGRYTVKINVTTTNRRPLTGTRAYHTCAPKPLPFSKPRL